MKNLILLVFTSALLFGGVCKNGLQEFKSLGNEYEQIFNPNNTFIPNIKVVYFGSREIDANQKINLSTKLIGNYTSKSFYYWTSSCDGVFSSKDNYCNNISWQPSKYNKHRVCTVKLYFGDGEGRLVDDELNFNVSAYDDNINEDPDNSNISTNLLTQYTPSTKKFTIAWQSHGEVEQIEVYYSYTKNSWIKLFGQNLGTIKSSSREMTIANSDSHHKIYFKVKSINVMNEISVESDITTLEYTPAKDYVKKGTEIPASPRLYSLGRETGRDNIEISWQRVNDSKKNDNVNYYEIEVASNRKFTDGRIINAGNNAKGKNIYESCSHRVDNLKDGTRAYFRVRGVNSLGAGSWSNVEHISIEIQDKPLLENKPKFPLINAVGISKQTPFKWVCSDADNDVLEFYITLGESADKLYYSTGWITSTSDKIHEISYESFRRDKPLKPNTKYYWQVKVREKGKKSDYYGGAYIKSPVWSFITQATGSDLAITYADVIGEVRPNQSVICRVNIKNVGTETARRERIQTLYKKDGKSTKFWKGSAYMKRALEAGGVETLNVTIKFRDEIFETHGETYDNVLVTGDSSVIFDFKNISEQDVSRENNRKEVAIHYDSTGKPIFEMFYLMSNYLFTNKKDFIRGIIGEDLTIEYRVRDDVKVTKVITEYRLSQNDSWKTIRTDTNNDDYIGEYFTWHIPNKLNHVTDTAEIRVRAYENDTSYSQKSFVFPIYSNKLELKNITFDKDSYTVGDEVIIHYDLIHDYDIRNFRVELKNPDTGERIKIIKEDYRKTASQPTGMIKFTIPNDNKYAGDKSYLYMEMYDIHELKILKNQPFPSIKVNNKLPSPFNSFIEVYKPLNNNVPSNAESYGRRSYNRIEKIIMDDNNKVHMVVASVAEYMVSNDSFTNINYYYITYDYNTKELSSPVEILISNQENKMFFKDFELLDNKPFVLFGKEYQSSKFYLSYKDDSSFTSLQEVLNKSTIKWNEVDFAQYKNKLYIKWVDTENGTSSVDRRNKRKEVYPNIDSEKNIYDTYLGYEVRVNNNHLYADCGKIFSLNNDLIINKLLFKSEDNSCRPMGEFKDFSTTHEIIDFFSVAFGDTRTKLIKKDFSILLLESKKDKTEVAIYDDKVITVGDVDDKNSITVYDSKFKKISELSFGKYTEFSDVYAKSDINKNQIMAISNLERYKAYLTIADLSNDITAPNITLTNSETTIAVGSSLNLSWTANDNNNELVRYEVYKVVNGEKSLLTTITDISHKNFTYTQENSSDKFIQLKVVAYDASGNSNYATLPLKVQRNITFNSFTIDKSEINLGEKIIFSWSSSGGDETTQYTVYRKATDETEWSRLFMTMGTSKNYVVKDFVGECSFKVVANSSFMELDSTLMVNGELLNFKEALFKPQNSYYSVNSHVKFEWFDTLTTPVSYDIWLKKSTESKFSKIGTTSDKYLNYFGDINTSFEWKVSAQFGEAIEESKVIPVTVKTLQSPAISDINFTLINDEPIINLKFKAIEGVESYILLKEYDGIYKEIPITENSYSDKSIDYGISYKYSIVALIDGIKVKEGVSKTIVASFNEHYEVIIDTSNNQLLDSNNFTLQYHPNKTVKYEKYEIWLGTSADSLMLYDVIGKRSYDFTNLKYATNYFVEIYPIDLNGNHISATPAKLKFTTGFDTREITTKPIITIDKVNPNSIHLSWSRVKNADEYKVCRSDNGSRYNCFAKTKELSYIDSVNIEPQNSYKYKIQAVNGFDFSISDATDVIVTPLNRGLRVVKDIATLTFDAIKLQNSVENNITGDLNLTKMGVNESNISWSSTSSVINVDTGSVDRTSLENDLAVTLKAFVNYGESNDSVEFHLVVKKIEVLLDTDKDGIPNDKDLDDDNDGISDVDEEKYGFNPLVNDANQDADGDGVSNIDEIRAGTDPKDKNDHPSTGMSREEQTLFMIIMNRSNQLNQEVSVGESTPQIKIPTILMIEAMKKEESKKN